MESSVKLRFTYGKDKKKVIQGKKREENTWEKRKQREKTVINCSNNGWHLGVILQEKCSIMCGFVFLIPQNKCLNLQEYLDPHNIRY